ncbi:unnamed protein product [Microthlaspi erraticum]|uniref:Arabidopsis retrotransposon Orf1 C-terminal domain-containing protein n=1 Tax=Microthlaspi erraticum TaxID=1685480 RepID=A0A6D2HG97_9BRAS|nr:unnamed protein product [Microthlaspi erraticum]
MEEAEPQEEEEELPMYQEHYNALFSMDFVETKYPQDDTMRTLGIFEDVELVLKNMQLASSSLTAWSLTRSSLKKIYSMDFIKTSSLRALIELTFQRNWNGLIWMSRKGVIAKRVKTAPDGSIENQRQAADRLAEERMFRARPKPSVRLKSRPKFLGRSHHDPGNIPAVGQATTTHATPHTTMPREPGSNASRPRNLLAYHGRCTVRAGKDVPRPAEKHRPNLHPSDHSRPTEKSSGHDRSDSATTRLSGRPSRPTVRTPRSTRKPAPT